MFASSMHGLLNVVRGSNVSQLEQLKLLVHELADVLGH